MTKPSAVIKSYKVSKPQRKKKKNLVLKNTKGEVVFFDDDKIAVE